MKLNQKNQQEQLLDILNTIHPLEFLKRLSKGIISDSEKQTLKRIKSSYQVSNAILNTVVLYSLSHDNSILNENYLSAIFSRAAREAMNKPYLTWWPTSDIKEFLNNFLLCNDISDTLGMMCHYFFIHWEAIK